MDVSGWNSALLLSAVFLSVNQVLWPAFPPLGVDGRSDHEGRLAVSIQGFGNQGCCGVGSGMSFLAGNVWGILA